MVELRSRIYFSDYSAINEMFIKLGNYHAELYPEFIKKDCEKRDTKQIIDLIMDPKTELVVAEEDYELVGFCLATVVEKKENDQVYGRKYMMINDIFVYPEHRRKGIGTQFVRYIEDSAKKRKIDTVELNCWAKNESANGFYKKLGYEPMLVRMTKKLTDQE